MREEHVPLSAGVAALEQELRRRELCDEICPMAPMAPRTTLRIGGAADLLVTPRSASAVAEIVALAREGGVPFLILGNGSNLLVSDLGVEGLVISLRETLCKTQREGNRLTAGAGLLLSAAAAFARDEGLSGRRNFHSQGPSARVFLPALKPDGKRRHCAGHHLFALSRPF